VAKNLILAKWSKRSPTHELQFSREGGPQPSEGGACGDRMQMTFTCRRVPNTTIWRLRAESTERDFVAISLLREGLLRSKAHGRGRLK
jgi:hypothetical protein